MYLVERRSGREELYRSKADLAAAIDRGEVDSESRIFHRTTSKWISITLHPLYKARMAAHPKEPLPPLVKKSWTFLPMEAPEGSTDAVAELAPEASAAEKAELARSQHRIGLGPLRALRRMLHS